jgi:putative ABC transport system substrate-binding protein
MQRREFITLLGGAAAWPLAARAQQAIKVYRVGYFFSTAPLAVMAGFDPIDPVTRAFVRGLRALGYIEGENLVMERRSAEGKFERIDEIAAELVSLKLDVIVTGSSDFMAQALRRVTKSVPIVVSGSFDPVGPGSWQASRVPTGTSRGSSNT